MEAKLILVVDDDAISRTLIKGFLKNEDNFTVDTVESGSDCLNYIEHNDVDLIISDVEMDNLDGIEMSKILLSREKYSNIPVILSSVRDESDVKRQSHDHKNIRKVVQKPYGRDQLLFDLKNIFPDQ